ncbi:histone-lysine N-methyltransferase SETMAR-like [Chelonus insularis]|uniref:histone-lysine N-methyltransferase SETMAR-like n=1 Tax=Chelonus insularis TaxID=460826 RepID=UPI00158A7B6B|nr:histone-lysine N-methyltransferase SETMAR-like [Chelonus insularis]
MAIYEQYEYVDMIRVLHECHENVVDAARLYAERFPDRDRHPCIQVLNRLQDRIRNHRPIVPVPSRDVGHPRNHRRDAQILNYFDRHPESSTRRAARHLNINHVTIHKTLKHNGLYPYHYTPVQYLEDGDLPVRLRFCRWFRRQVRDEDFLKNILWTDEAIFRQDGPYNLHNEHIYAHENPRCVREKITQRRFQVHVWCGLIHDQLIGPVILPNAVNGDVYLEILRDLPQLLEDVPLQRRANIIWQQDGATAHRRRDVLNCLDNLFPDGWIGLESWYREWPPRSPDMTPLDFFLWGYLKDKVYATPVLDEEDLQNRIIEEALAIPPEMIKRATNRVLTVVNQCIEEDGGHAEQLR